MLQNVEIFGVFKLNIEFYKYINFFKFGWLVLSEYAPEVTTLLRRSVEYQIYEQPVQFVRVHGIYRFTGFIF